MDVAEITVPDEKSVAHLSQPDSIVEMIGRAATDPKVDIDKMERLMQMHVDVVEREAKTAFAAALAEMQPNLPAIPQLGRGQGGAKYARWEDIQIRIMPVLSKYGFALSFKTNVEPGTAAVTAVLSHKSGHSEETTLALPVDAGGQKNDVQAVGSSVKYAMRYTACAMLNINVGGEDDDGHAAGKGETINQEQFGIVQDLIEAAGSSAEKLCNYLKVDALANMSVRQFIEATNSLKTKIAQTAVAANKGGSANE